MNFILSKYWLLIAGLWYLVNGMLHDIFVLRGHKGGYDRELLRLLMDGHVLIFSGAIMLIAWFMLPDTAKFGAIAGIATTAAMLVYCIMIFPFLKSIGTIAVSSMAMAACIKILLAL
jgi:hypothetical protein